MKKFDDLYFEKIYSELISKPKGDLIYAWKDVLKYKKSETITEILTVIAIHIAFGWLCTKFGIKLSSILWTTFMAVICDYYMILILRGIFQYANEDYNSIYKQKIIKILLEKIFNQVNYIPEQGIPLEIYKEGQYKDRGNRYTSDDYIETKIDNKYNIKMAEVHITVKSDDDPSEETTFQGIFAKIELDENIKNDLIIISSKKISKKEKLEMDSAEFEKYFDVSSKNEITGMQILTHDVMELLVDYRKQMNCPFDIRIIGNVVYVRLHTGSVFEAKVNLKTVIDKKQTKKYYDILEFMKKLTREVIKISSENYE